jgi:hypothetical protein
MTKAKKVITKKNIAVKETELDKVIKNFGTQIEEAVKKNIKVLKTVKCTKEQLTAFAKLKNISNELQELNIMFDNVRKKVWGKIEKEIGIKSFYKKGTERIDIKFVEEKKILQVIENKNPRNVIMDRIIKI